MLYKFTSTVIVYQGPSAWRFLVLPKKAAGEIKKLYAARAKSWGSIPVSVRVGETTWKTSLFPDSKSGTYLLPLKAKVRAAEDILDGDTVTYEVQIQ